MFKKILIANRGEIALRIIRTCKEMGVATVAIYSTADKDSLHVRFADEAVCVGGPKVQDSYLNIPAIISAAEITNADAIHPGYGFFAENSNFVKICKEHDIKFIGPTAEMIDKMGDKASAKALMKKAGVPTIPGSDGLVKDVKQGLKLANEMGYPVILKATAGGGGKGMREVWKEEDFETAWNLASSEAQASFSNGSLYLEKFIEDPKHIEIQVIGDSHGNAAHLSERDCSIQRRHQKLVEETPSPIMTNALRKKMGEAAVKAVKAAKYDSVGTIEFLVDKHKNFYFMEMNTRIQVEHTITEEVISYDLVKEQIKVAMGERISGRNYIPKLHAMECRINAEDPYDDFKPSPGKITSLHLPGGHGIRIDTHVYQGYVIPPFYDSMIGKLIAIGQTREEVIQTMRRALEEFVIEGIATTIPFHLKLLNDPDFIAGKYTTKFMEDFKM
jgi:acetyl-CoA carboxylase biotin carboxylase subunit